MGKTLQFIVEVQTPDRGTVQTNVAVEFDFRFPTTDDVLTKVGQIASEATQNVAAPVLGTRIPAGDASYFELLEEAAKRYSILSIKKIVEGQAPVRFYFEGVWPSGENMFGQHVWAVDEDDAIFQGRWTMATTPNDGVESTRQPHIKQLIAFMESVDVATLHVDPLSKDEAIDLLMKVYSANRFGHTDDMEEAIEQIRVALETAGRLPEEPSSAPTM